MQKPESESYVIDRFIETILESSECCALLDAVVFSLLARL